MYFEEAMKQACNYAENVLCYRCFYKNLAKTAILTKQKPVDYSPGGIR